MRIVGVIIVVVGSPDAACWAAAFCSSAVPNGVVSIVGRTGAALGGYSCIGGVSAYSREREESKYTPNLQKSSLENCINLCLI